MSKRIVAGPLAGTPLADRFPITPTEKSIGVYRALEMHDQLTLTEVADRAGCSPDNAYTVLKALKRADLVESRPYPMDARKDWYSLADGAPEVFSD